MTLRLQLPGGVVTRPVIPGERQGGEVRQVELRAFCTSHAVAARIAEEIAQRRDKLFSAEGERRLRRDAAFMLHEAGKIRNEQLRASMEIAAVFAAITRGLQPRVTAAYEERVPSGIREDELPPGLKTAMIERYAPWREWAGRMPATSRSSLADLTLLVSVDNLGMRQVGSRLGMDQRTVLRHLQQSLWQYALIGSWVRESREVA